MTERIAENNIEILRELCVSEAMEYARERVRDSFNSPELEDDELDFHSLVHTDDVIRRVTKILETMAEVAPDLVRIEDFHRARIAAAFHDLIQKWKEKSVDGKIIRDRDRGNNELASSDGAIDFLKTLNYKNNQEIFTEEDLEGVREAIMVTIPDWNPSLKTVIQRNLSADSSIVTYALALADINSAGIDGGNKFILDGDLLFLEENLDIKRKMKNPESLLDNEKSSIKDRIMKWGEGQIKFAEGRKIAFVEEIKNLPEKLQEALLSLFNKFDESIAMEKDETVKREKMSFDELMHALGYIKTSR